MEQLTQQAITLLKDLIKTQSFSKQEGESAMTLERFFKRTGIPVFRSGNNVWCCNKHFDATKPNLLLNSHHDTVEPVENWTRDPFHPEIVRDVLFGLGSNDAGGSLVSLISAFIYLYSKKDLSFNLILAATAEEEISGSGGIESIIDNIGPFELGIIGEPTSLNMAVAEKGLMVLDGESAGVAGHAAREEGVNAIYTAIEDIQKLRNCEFEKKSSLLEDIKITATKISAGTQHNVVPDKCTFVIDVRTNDMYSNQEVFDVLQKLVQSKLTARSFRLNSSQLDSSHPLISCAEKLDINTFGSSTLSDQALLSFPTVKIGPGESARSHTADEFILISELRKGIRLYVDLISMYSESLKTGKDEIVV